MSTFETVGRLNPEKIAAMLKFLQELYPHAEITRCQATSYYSEIRFNITVADHGTWKRSDKTG